MAKYRVTTDAFGTLGTEFDWDGVTRLGSIIYDDDYVPGPGGFPHLDSEVELVEEPAPKVQVIKEEVITEKIVGVNVTLTAEEAIAVRDAIGSLPFGGVHQDLYDRLAGVLDG